MITPKYCCMYPFHPDLPKLLGILHEADSVFRRLREDPSKVWKSWSYIHTYGENKPSYPDLSHPELTYLAAVEKIFSPLL